MSQCPDYYGSKAWLPKEVTGAAKKIRNAELQFDSFAVRGISGIVFGAKLAHLMKKNLVVVRKDESTHSRRRVEGLAPKRYLFVDDFVSTGATREAVKCEIRRVFPTATMVGSYLYENTTDQLQLEQVA